jgi:hypothetical protein
VKLEYETPEPKPQKNWARYRLTSVGKAILIVILLYLAFLLLATLTATLDTH